MEFVQHHLRDYLLAGSHPHIVTDFLDQNTTLIPVPRSAPLSDKTALWPSATLSDKLVRGGLGKRVLPVLRRVHQVPKSALATRGDRPTPEIHFASLTVDHEIQDVPGTITLVDDIVTRGATLIAAASRLKKAFPKSMIRAFALVRTMSLIDNIENRRDPCCGRITYDGQRPDRQP